MDEKLFDELISSVKEAGAIYRSEKTAKRRFSFSPLDVKAIREKTGLSQARFAIIMGVSVPHVAKLGARASHTARASCLFVTYCRKRSRIRVKGNSWLK